MNRPRLLAIAALGALLGAASSASPLDRMSGRYNRHQTSGDNFGYVYQIDDVLEIVPLDRRRAYFRVRTNFANHHSCAIHGVAYAVGRDLVYRAARRTPNGRCEMRLRVTGNGIDLVDVGGSCRWATCGVRGGYDAHNPEFRLSTRRPIRYLARLRRSPQYLEALREDEGRWLPAAP